MVYVDSVAPLESHDEATRRFSTISRLEEYSTRWLETESANDIPGKLLAFGSSILGVVTNKSDLDAVLMIPSTITRETFFSGFVQMLREASADLAIESIMAVPDAHVPVLKLVVDGLPVDILPCRVPQKRLLAVIASAPEDGGQFDFRHINMSELDTPSVLALNGVRVGRTLVDSIRAGRIVTQDEPIQGGDERFRKFQVCLRGVKYWAKERGIYSNALGFFGGVTWAILLVKVCLSCISMDDLSDREILGRFFQFLFEQSWGSANPITLRPLPQAIAQFVASLRPGSTPNISAVGSPDSDSEKSRESLWDPSVSEADKRALMPVLTPVAPYLNSTFNVVPTTQRILTDEFRRAFEITKTPHWSMKILCSPAVVELEKNYPTRLRISISAKPESSDKSKWLFVWESLVSSKLRVLLYHLERIPGLIARPDPLAIRNAPEDSIEFRIYMSILPLNGSGNRLIDFNEPVSQFHGALATAIESRDDQDDLRSNCKLAISLVKDPPLV
jgi:poly(A) polymerase